MKQILSRLTTNILLGCLLLANASSTLSASGDNIRAAIQSAQTVKVAEAEAKAEGSDNEPEDPPKPNPETSDEKSEDQSKPNPENPGTDPENKPQSNPKDEADGKDPIPPTSPHPAEDFKFKTDLIIKAINPGYTVDGARDVGELIELQNLTDSTISLAGYTLRYVNSSGKVTTLVNFSEGSSMAGEFLLLRLARTSNSAEAEATYATTLSMSTGKLELLSQDTIVDQICWSKDDTCADPFNSKKPTFLVRSSKTGEFEHVETYTTHYDAKSPTLILPPDDESPEDPKKPEGSKIPADSKNPSSTKEPNGSDNATGTDPTDSQNPVAPVQPHCQGLELTEILSYYAENKSEQYLEIYNPTDNPIDLAGCSIRYKKKLYPLSSTLTADHYSVFYPTQVESPFAFTKNPSSSNTIELIDADGTVVDALEYSHGQKKAVAFAKFYEADGSEFWAQTYAQTPGAANVYQEFRTCPEGKIINPLTGNCIKASSGSSKSAASTATACPAGKERNPLTGRCKKIKTATEPKTCAEGYERNPETNRCRKIKIANEGADYALVPTTYTDEKTFTAMGIILGVVVIGVSYIILQFRREITRAFRKIRQRLHHIRKDLVARGIGFHRNKKS